MAEPSYQQVWSRPFTVVANKEIPDTAGYSVHADHFYFDRDFHKAVAGGGFTTPQGKLIRVVIPGIHPIQILNAILIHERTEKSLMDADNHITTYQESHEMATLAEHQYVRSIGVTPKVYEDALEGIIAYNEKKPITEPPLDLECSPYLDDPDADDLRVLAIMRKLGVADATKQPKEKNKYSASTGKDQCQVCQSWLGHPVLNLTTCQKINGLVRDHWWCKLFHQMEKIESGEENQGLPSGGPQGQAAPGDGNPGGPENPGSQAPSGGNPNGQPGEAA